MYFKQGQNDASKNKSFLRRCVEFDIQNSKVKKIITDPDQLQEIKDILENNYAAFKNVYYYLSNNSVNGHNNIFHISQTKIDHFLDFMKFQTKTLTYAKIRLKIITTLSLNDQFSKKRIVNSQFDQKLFNRPQFFQFLLRIAIQKYTKKKSKSDQPESEIIGVQQGLKKIIERMNIFESTLHLPQQWRRQNIYIYDISLVIKSYENFIEAIYHHYCGMFQKNLNNKLQKKMLLNEFKQIFLDANMRKTRQALRDAQTAFIQSKKLQIQEGIKQYGLNMNQFIQSLVRMAYLNDIKPIGTQQNKVWERIQQMQTHHQIKISQEVYFQVPLFLKLQALFQRIYKQNRSLYHSRRMDRIFSKGIFSDQIQMLIDILKQRIEEYHQKYKPLILQKKYQKKAKLNTMEDFEQKQIKHHEERIHHKITLEYLVQQLKQKFKRISEQLDKNFSQYEQVNEVQAQLQK